MIAVCIGGSCADSFGQTQQKQINGKINEEPDLQRYLEPGSPSFRDRVVPELAKIPADRLDEVRIKPIRLTCGKITLKLSCPLQDGVLNKSHEHAYCHKSKVVKMTGSERVVIELPDDLLFGKNGNEDPFHARGLGCLLGKKNQKYIAIDYWNGQQMIDYLSLNNGKFVYWRGRNLGNHEIIKNPGGSPPEETAWKMLISH